MSRLHTYRIIITTLLVYLFFSGCNSRFDERVTFWRNDKIPYGTYYAYNNLSHLFTDAYIETNNKSPLRFYGLEETSCAYIIVGSNFKPDEKELKAILNYAYAGNQVFISALEIGMDILDSFKLATSQQERFFMKQDSLTISMEEPVSYDSLSFTYPGISMDRYFTKMDSSITTILGKDQRGRANFVKFNYENGGALFLHLAPVAFTNFFLLHKQNKKYYDLALSNIPDSVETVRWDDYYRHHINGENEAERSGFSKLSVFLNNEVLRWAFWLGLLLFAIIYFFESKRKQRMVQVQKLPENTSLDFVKTIGRLYFQKKDNRDLAEKIGAHFLMHVRNTYHLTTSNLDEDFENRLAYKSGYPLALVKEITGYMQNIETRGQITDEDLLAFNDKIDTFIHKP